VLNASSNSPCILLISGAFAIPSSSRSIRLDLLRRRLLGLMGSRIHRLVLVVILPVVVTELMIFVLVASSTVRLWAMFAFRALRERSPGGVVRAGVRG